MPTAAERFAALADQLAEQGVVRSAMFGKPTLKASNGKSIACLFRDGVAFPLGVGTPEHAIALALRGAELFDPSAKDRPMKDWVVVPAAHAKHWPAYAAAAKKRVAG